MKNRRNYKPAVKKKNLHASPLWSKTSSLKYLQLPVFALLFLLMKLGEIVQEVILFLIGMVKKTAPKVIDKLKPTEQISLRPKHFTLIKLKLPRLHRHRGRPRITSWKIFYLRKIKKKFNHLFPKSLRFKITLTVIFISIFCYSFFIIKFSSQIPSPKELTLSNRPLTTQILDRNGNLLYQIYEGRNREIVELDQISPYLKNATVAIEDKHFYYHPGVDPLGIFRAIQTNLAIQGDAFKGEGGSTITQQLIKNTMLTPDQTLSRKIKEAALAFWTERIYTKDEILKMYLNEAPYGGPAWGIQAAAQMYFGKSAKDINLAESAFLAGLTAAPTNYSPYGIHPEKSKQRQGEVLRRMTEDGYITPGLADAALSETLNFRPRGIDIKAPHFVMYVRQLLASKYGERVVSQGGLKVVTTLDLKIQEMAEDVVENQVSKLAKLKVGNGAAMISDAANGQILAMVGSKNYFDPQDGSFNVALALRQPGSSIKPVTYATAFKEGYGPATILLDTPITYKNPWGQSYSPINYDSRFHGPVTIRTALGSSYNIPAVKMLASTGLPAMLETAKNLGITSLNNPDNYGLSLTLGGGAVKMIEMMSVYNTFASGGIKYTPQAILTVTDAEGNILEDHQQDTGKRVLSEEIAYLITHILSDDKARVPAFGAKSLLNIDGYTVAVKTGTSDDKRDNLTFGFNPEYVVGVWVGNNDNSPMDPKLTSGITGAAPIWHDIMANLLTGKPDTPFKRPIGVVEVTVRGRKDLGIAGQSPRPMIGYQNEATPTILPSLLPVFAQDQSSTTQ